MAKKFKVEFPNVLVEYPSNDGKKNDAFVVVSGILADNNAIIRVKGTRKFKKTAEQHAYYKPMIVNKDVNDAKECKCRQCGKMFKSAVKEAAWCSKDCRHAHRIKRTNARTKTP